MHSSHAYEYNKHQRHVYRFELRLQLLLCSVALA